MSPLPITDERGQALGCNELVAATDEFRNFIPIDFTDVEAKSDPSFRSHVGGQKESAGLRVGESSVVSGQNLAIEGDDAVPVMVVEEIGERFFRIRKPAC